MEDPIPLIRAVGWPRIRQDRNPEANLIKEKIILGIRTRRGYLDKVRHYFDESEGFQSEEEEDNEDDQDQSQDNLEVDQGDNQEDNQEDDQETQEEATGTSTSKPPISKRIVYSGYNTGGLFKSNFTKPWLHKDYIIQKEVKKNLMSQFPRPDNYKLLYEDLGVELKGNSGLIEKYMKKYLKNLTLPTSCAIHLADALEDEELDRIKLTNAATGVLVGLFNAAAIIDDDRETNMQIKLTGKPRSLIRAFNSENKKMSPKLMKKVKEIRKISIPDQNKEHKPRQTQSFGKAASRPFTHHYPSRGRRGGRVGGGRTGPPNPKNKGSESYTRSDFLSIDCAPEQQVKISNRLAQAASKWADRGLSKFIISRIVEGIRFEFQVDPPPNRPCQHPLDNSAQIILDQFIEGYIKSGVAEEIHTEEIHKLGLIYAPLFINTKKREDGSVKHRPCYSCYTRHGKEEGSDYQNRHQGCISPPQNP
eukprot:TRINITY_DN8600_c0_g1_i3.p1 TRINITY_DN8600_c0_g1~~TRINITY_DN8600_c0_g1_i3.p1  ORF type:complete len:497 (-),score=34.07 TRINITY_DN8600_c0_g1_i3:2179-3606(-)